MKQPFYHNTVRKIIVSFGTLFNELQIDREDSNGVFQTKPVPIKYSTKEKFIERIMNVKDISDDKLKLEETMPRIGFEMTGMQYDSSRKTNTLNKHISIDKTKFVFNRVPYLMNFTMYIATRKIDDSLRIIEQIVPYFTPELTLRIKDIEELGVLTNIPIILNNTDYTVDAGGSMDDRRTIVWELTFTAKFYLYASTRPTSLIKKATIDFKDIDSTELFESYIAEVDPITANVDDTYNIIESVV